MKTIYPYDPDASLATNRVTDEVDVSLYPNQYNVVVPERAPFYRLDLEVRDVDDRLLIEGLDYYLAYYSKEISEATGKPVYGGIMLFDAKRASVKLRTVGGNHMVPPSEIGRFLTKVDLQEPRNVNWSELQRYPTAVTPVNKPDSLEEALEKDAVVKALDGVRQSILKKIGELDSKYDAMIEAISAVAMKIGDHDLWTHHKTPHEHKYTRDDLNVLGVDETAADAIKAYGLTLQEVVDEMLTFGINQSRIDDLLNDTLDRTVKGRFNVSGSNDLVLQHESGNAKVTLDGYLFELETAAGEVVFEADTDFNNPGIGLEIGAGYNVLLVPSAGGVQGDYPSFNGKILITVDNILNYLHKPEPATANVKTQDTNTVKWSGRGVVTSPLRAKATPPLATADVSGLWRITDSLLILAPGFGISQWAITQIKNALNGYVDKTFTVNGIPFGVGGTVDLTKSHIGLDRVDDTSPEEKPVTDALTAATKDKAKEGHAHANSDLNNVPYATNSKEGLARLHSTFDTTSNRAATPKLGQDLRDLIDEVEEDVSGRVKAGAASATHYGGNGYLPVPALGNYSHANIGTRKFYGEVDKNNKFVFLESGASMFGFGLYYAELQLNESGDVVYYNPTSVAYQPDFLRGKLAKDIFKGYDGVFRIRDEDERDWVILTRNTMDMTKHVGARLTSVLPTNVHMFLYKEYVYGVQYWTDSHQPHFRLLRTLLSSVVNGEEVTFEPVVLSGLDIFGNVINDELIKFAPLGISSDPTAQARIIREDGGKWANVNFSHATQNWDMATDGSLLRVFGYHRPYVSTSYSSSSIGGMTASIDIDLDTLTFTIADPELMKVKLTEKGFSDVPGSSNEWRGIKPNNISMRVISGRFAFGSYWYGRSRPMTTTVYRLDKGIKHIDLCKRARPTGVHQITTLKTALAQPSLVQIPQCDFALLDEETLVFYDNIGGYVEAKLDRDVPYPGFDGLGPTTHRVRSPINRHQINRITRDVTSEPGVNQGIVINAGQTAPSKLVGHVFSDEYTFEKDHADEVLRYLRPLSIEELNLDPELLIDDAIGLVIFGDPTNYKGAFVVYNWLKYSSAAKNNKHVDTFVYKVDVTATGGKLVVDTSSVELIAKTRYSSTATSLGGGFTSYGTQSIYRLLPNGDEVFLIQTGIYSGYIGWGGYPTWRLGRKVDGSWVSNMVGCNHGYLHNYVMYHPDLGWGKLTYATYGDAIIYNQINETLDDILHQKYTPVAPAKILVASRASEGWVVYFTQDMPFYAEEVLYSVPKSTFDLRQLFPGSYANRTFYIHVDVSDGNPKYTIDEVIKPDTPTRLWIGHVTTNDDRIVELVADRIRRLGNIATLIQHEHNKHAHGYDYSDTLRSSKYTLLENKGMVHDFDVVSFKDIFNSWYRFSHTAAGNYPADPNETTKWRYLEEYDCIESTINSSTFIGFISDEMAGDYVFNTVVSSNNSDDDAIFVVLGAFKQGDVDDKEHTLTVQVNAGGFGTTTPHVCIIKDHNQKTVERIVNLDPTSDGSSAGTGWMETGYYEVYHIWAKRVKNELLVYVDRKQLPTPANSWADYEAKVSEYVESVRPLRESDFEARQYLKASINLSEQVPLFAQPSRFGYGAHSQSVARFWNIERPLSNLNEFYSSEQMLLESMKKTDDNYRMFSGRTAKAGVGDIYSGTNYSFLMWQHAVENEYSGATTGNYARPHPSAKYVSPTHSFKPPSNHQFILKKKIKVNSSDLRVVAVADDALNLFVGDVDQGRVGSSTSITTDITVVPGELILTFICHQIPGSTPSFCAFAIYDGLKLIDVSDESWYCYYNTGEYNEVFIAEVKYNKPKDCLDVFSLKPTKTDWNIGTRTIGEPSYDLTAPDKDVVTRYVDVSKGDVAWDVSLIKKKV